MRLESGCALNPSEHSERVRLKGRALRISIRCRVALGRGRMGPLDAELIVGAKDAGDGRGHAVQRVGPPHKRWIPGPKGRRLPAGLSGSHGPGRQCRSETLDGESRTD